MVKQEFAPRPAWVEIDLTALRSNFQLINRERPKDLAFLSVVKDRAYGHGAVPIARVALELGASALGVVTLQEAIELREARIQAPILLFGDRHPSELPYCVSHRLACCLSDVTAAKDLARLACQAGITAGFHFKIDTGMNRYGMPWDRALGTIEEILELPGLTAQGLMSHFAMSDEVDKSFARLQLSRFHELLRQLNVAGIALPLRHFCNSGGFLDLPEAHLDMVRIGLLPLGVYPSTVCRRIEGLAPVMTVKTRIAALKNLRPGDYVGYGLRYRASAPRRIAVVPIGYGDGFPRIRNQGSLLVHGRRAPIVGSVSMDAATIDVTEIPNVSLWDEVVVMGRQGNDEITVHDLAKLKQTVSYDVLANWRWRLPRLYGESDNHLAPTPRTAT